MLVFFSPSVSGRDAAVTPGGDGSGGPGPGPGVRAGLLDPAQPTQLPRRRGVSVFLVDT